MPQILASSIMSFCMVLITVGFVYCLWDGRIDIEFLKFRIIGKGSKK
jgi:hypothetical protein